MLEYHSTTEEEKRLISGWRYEGEYFEKVDVIKDDHTDSVTGEISDCYLYSLSNSRQVDK